MLTKNKLIILMVSIIAGCICNAQPAIPADFKETPAPKSGSTKWFQLNHSKNEYGVANENGKLTVKKVKEINTHEFQLPNGKLVCVDHGEWGGSLSFVPTDTTQQVKKIMTGNIKDVFKLNNEHYVLEGLAHLGMSDGALFKLEIKDQEFSYTKLLDFEDAPEAYTVYNNKILIAAHESFFVVQDFQKNQILKDTFWSSLYPNSIAAFDDQNIFIGIRGGIVKLNLVTNTFKFYKPGN
jgi:hypothetical protein